MSTEAHKSQHSQKCNQIWNRLANSIYKEPLSFTRNETDYPNLDNPFHTAILLIDCDTEIVMSGTLGFIENSTGRYLEKTIEALYLIGAPKCAGVLESVQKCMNRHGITWEILRGDFEDAEPYQITTFHKLHKGKLDEFAREIDEIAYGFSVFNVHYAPEDSAGAFCRYLLQSIDEIELEIERRLANKGNACQSNEQLHDDQGHFARRFFATGKTIWRRGGSILRGLLGE